ncbi:MAG: O-antigen ligase family protein [Chloroflexota bacterium]|nr:O-antigen ligase family protein [Chloroflexota bacterium]
MIAGLAASAALVGLAAAMDRLPYVGAGIGAIGFAAVAIRAPRVALLAYVALLPLQGFVLVDQIGTLPRAVGVVLAATYLVSRLLQLQLRVIPVGGWAFMAFAATSVLWALDPDFALSGVLSLLQQFALALLIADLVSKDLSAVRPVMWAYSLSATLVAVLGSLNLMSQSSAVDGRASVFAEGPAWFATSLMPAFLFLLHESLNRGPKAALALPALFLCGLGLLMSGTRSAWLALAVVIIVFALPRLRAAQRLALVGALSLMTLGSLQLPGILPQLIARTEAALDTGGAGRLAIWQVGLNIVASHPIIGVGYFNFPVAFGPTLLQTSSFQIQQLPTLAPVTINEAVVRFNNEDRYVPGESDVQEPRGFGAHNTYLAILAELGPVGLALLLWFFLAMIWRPAAHPYGRVLQTVVLAFLIQAFFLDLLNPKVVWLMFALTIGVLYGTRALGARAQSDESRRTSAQRSMDQSPGGRGRRRA